MAPEDNQDYVYQPEKGLRLLQADDPSHWPVFSGRHLRLIHSNDYSDPETLIQSKQLSRFLLSLHLPDTAMTTRQILIDLKKI
jgi:DNA repair protein RecO (recombination protein O)